MNWRQRINGTRDILVRADNKTRLRWTSGDARDGTECVPGWILEENTKEVRSEVLNCSDTNAAAQAYLEHKLNLHVPTARLTARLRLCGSPR